MTSRSISGVTGDWTRRSAVMAIAFLLVLVVLPLVSPSYFTFQASRVLSLAITIMGLNLLTGFSGQVSLGHNLFFAIGAYTVAYLMSTAGWPFVAALVAAGVVAGVAGVIVGLPALRVRGLYLALLTLSLGIVTPTVARRLKDITNGSAGVQVKGMPVPDWIGLTSEQWNYYLAIIVAVIAFWFARNMARGGIGRTLKSIRDNELASVSVGINIPLYKTFAFMVSAVYAGVGGGLFTVIVGYVAPESFDFTMALALITGSVVGGVVSVWGAIFGAAFITYIPVVATDIDDALTGVIYGVALLLTLYLMPNGIVGEAPGIWEYLKYKVRHAPGKTPPEKRLTS
ncbi:Branched-chain amino acid transport system permease protein OS=Castellaniella defragrans OX=75697 GN=HNR28_000088 PE=4 SV=1 [Castellaniella defragrans]